MTDIFLKLKKQLDNKHPFALYAKPGSSVLTAVFQNTGEEFTNNELSGAGFLFAPFADGETVFIPYQKTDVVVTAITDALVLRTEPALLPEINTNAKQHFEQLVTNCVTAIKTGGFEKLVASRTEFVETAAEVEVIFRRLLGTYPNAFRYCFYSPVSGLWMGATPEQLLKAEGNTINTVALAGTQVFNPENDAVWQEKEKQEQQFVTDYILNELQPLVAEVNASAPYTFRAGNIVHIKTDVSAKLKEEVLQSDVINTLHPTPAVCGLPKLEARDFLIGHEGYNREYYSGFLGEINHDFASGKAKTDLFVNLRSMKLENNMAQLFIGCGITKDSDPEKEFIETVNKSLTMHRVL